MHNARPKLHNTNFRKKKIYLLKSWKSIFILLVMNHDVRTLLIVVVVAQLQHFNSPSWINICDFPSQVAFQGHNLQISMLKPKWYNTLLPNLLLQNWAMNINWHFDYQMLNLESWTVNGLCTMHIANTSIEGCSTITFNNKL